MPTATAIVKRSPEACWRVLIDASTLSEWIPGLHRARVLQSYATGLPREIEFELKSQQTFSLLYTYDHGNNELRFEPSRAAARGFAKLEPHDAGTRLTYTTDGEPPIDLDALVAGFASWMHAY